MPWQGIKLKISEMKLYLAKLHLYNAMSKLVCIYFLTKLYFAKTFFF